MGDAHAGSAVSGKVLSHAIWADGGGEPAKFDDVQAAEKRLLALGATKPAHQPGGDHWTVLLDPSGQPFCISSTR